MSAVGQWEAARGLPLRPPVYEGSAASFPLRVKAERPDSGGDLIGGIP